MNSALYIVIRSCEVEWYLPSNTELSFYKNLFETEIRLNIFQAFLDETFHGKIFQRTYLIVADFPEMTFDEQSSYLHSLSGISKEMPVFVPFLDLFKKQDPVMVLFGDIDTYGFLIADEKVVNYPVYDMGEGMPGSAKKLFYESMHYLALYLSNVLEESSFIREIKSRFHILSMDDLKKFVLKVKRSEIIEIATLAVHFGSINQHVYQNYSCRLEEIKNIAYALVKEEEMNHISLVFAGCFFKKDTLLKEEIIRHISKIKHVDQILFVDQIIEKYIRRNEQ